MVTAHNLGFPRIGARRELKRAVEAYWKGELGREELEATGRDLRARHWQQQAEAGLDYVPVGDFSWYDQVLDMSALLGAVPERFGPVQGKVDLDTYFVMARGRSAQGSEATPFEMTKWFDTNYHYMVPEFTRDMDFQITSDKLFDELDEAVAAGYQPKPVLLGPLSYLWLGKTKGEEFDKLTLIERLLPVYTQILERLAKQGATWVQIDEPILVLDLPEAWQQAFRTAYRQLADVGPKTLVATYFGGLEDNTSLALQLPVAALHLDLVRAPEQLAPVLDTLPDSKVLSLGLVDGRNVWRTDLEAALERLEPVAQQLGKDRLWIAPSCSLLHSPVDLALEEKLDEEIKSWLAFSVQKIAEVALLKRALTEGRSAVAEQLAKSHQANEARRNSSYTYRPKVRERTKNITEDMVQRDHDYPTRREAQRKYLQLPDFPTTTIGSFPQTSDIRRVRRDYKAGKLSKDEYNAEMRKVIEQDIRAQESLGLDVLVHGEPERNDMVEYFGELMEGFAFTANGWVQSFGSRCVKPPIIYGDVSRPNPMTVDWITYAQSLTDKPVKGMLTGPVTILQWSFVRDDLPRSEVAMQIGFGLRDEVQDLQDAGIQVIQIDEPAFREGLPLRRKNWEEYLNWAVKAFRLASSGVRDDVQIHTHMCYSEFNDIIDSIAALDADVITIETSRSDMELLDAFVDYQYPNEIGPGVYDIHAPLVPDVQKMVELMQKASKVIPKDRLWVNPDCGLKTRDWPETKSALANMVEAAREARSKVATA